MSEKLKQLEEFTTEAEVFTGMDDFALVNDASSFALSLRFMFPKFSKGINASHFENFIVEYVGKDKLKSLGRLSFPNEWHMEVTDKAIREKLIRLGKTKIRNRTCWIWPLSESEIRGYVHWLPTKIDNQVVKDILGAYGEVLFIENQKLEIWDGVIGNDSRYYSLYLRAGKCKDDLPHFLKIKGFNCLITARGRRPACFHCKGVGHRKSECKKFKEKLNGFCQRPANSAPKRLKPRGHRYVPPKSKGKDGETSTNVVVSNSEVAAVSSAAPAGKPSAVKISKEPDMIISSVPVLDVLEKFQSQFAEIMNASVANLTKDLEKVTILETAAVAPEEKGDGKSKKRRNKRKKKKNGEAANQKDSETTNQQNS